jgi:hypothetical protein
MYRSDGGTGRKRQVKEGVGKERKDQREKERRRHVKKGEGRYRERKDLEC